MRATRWAAVPAVVLGVTVIAGCSADGESTADPGETPQADAVAPEPAAAAPPVTEAPADADICTAFGDVLTIVENADLALASGRMETQEHDGWYQLATRVLDRLPSAGDSAVQAAIGELQEIAPAVPSGAQAAPDGVRSAEWSDAEQALGAACDGVGAPLAISVFTGG